MKINTTRFGEVEVNEDEIFRFTQGPVGFSKVQKYVRLANQLGESTPFRWLQSIEDPDMAFVIVDPTSFFPEYKVNLKKNEIEDLEIDEGDDVQVFTVVVIPEKVRDMTANLRAPILINENKKLCKQLIMQDSDYSLRYKIMEEMENRVKEQQGESAGSPAAGAS